MDGLSFFLLHREWTFFPGGLAALSWNGELPFLFSFGTGEKKAVFLLIFPLRRIRRPLDVSSFPSVMKMASSLPPPFFQKEGSRSSYHSRMYFFLCKGEFFLTLPQGIGRHDLSLFSLGRSVSVFPGAR